MCPRKLLPLSNGAKPRKPINFNYFMEASKCGARKRLTWYKKAARVKTTILFLYSY